MTYLDLVAAIEALAREAGAASFWTGAKTANGINYNEPFPMCEFFNTQPRALLPSVVRYSIGMGFYGKDAHENATYVAANEAPNPGNTIQIQSDMDELVQRFEMLLREEADGFELVDRPGGAVIGTPTIRNGTKIGTGLFIDFTIDVARVC